MSPQECAELIAEMSATWPQREMTKPEQRIWHDELKGRQVHLARQAVRDLRTTCDWLPTHNQFIAAYQSVARREALARPALPEAPTPGTSNRIASREFALAKVAEMRLSLTPKGQRVADTMEALAKRQPSQSEGEQ